MNRPLTRRAIPGSVVYIKRTTALINGASSTILSFHPSFPTCLTISPFALAALLLLIAAGPALAQAPAGVELKVALTSPRPDGFEAAVVAANVPPPGLFGAQFDLRFDPRHLQLIEDSVAPGPALEPALVARRQVEPLSGALTYAISRQGEVEGLSGNVTLAILVFKQITPTLQTSVSLDNVILGDKTGAVITVEQLTPLTLAPAPPPLNVTGFAAAEGAPQHTGLRVNAAPLNGTALSQLTEPDGRFSFFNLPPGSYQFSVEKEGYLAATCAVVTPAASVQLAPVTLRAGDVDGNGQIELADAVAIGLAMNTPSPSALDFNVDGRIDILDFILLAANYGQTSAENPWLCQPQN